MKLLKRIASIVSNKELQDQLAEREILQKELAALADYRLKSSYNTNRMSKQISIRIPDEVALKLITQVDNENSTLTKVVTKALRQYLGRIENPQVGEDFSNHPVFREILNGTLIIRKGEEEVNIRSIKQLLDYLKSKKVR